MSLVEFPKAKVPKTKAQKAAQTIHAAGVAESIAARVKDPAALERALLAKLEAQRDFAAEYQSRFPDGRYATSGAPRKEEWCLSYGFALRSVQRWLELLDAKTFVDRKNAIFKRCWQLMGLWESASFSSESVEWYTPARYLEAVREVLGEIDLDPASTPEANAVIRAKKFFTKEQDGLQKKWQGRVFMNPPYGKTSDGKSMAAEFCNKAIAEYECGNAIACIILVNSLHSQPWQAPLYGYPVCFVGHRIQFVSGDGEENKNPTFQNIFVYLGKAEREFAAVFSRLGYVMRKI